MSFCMSIYIFEPIRTKVGGDPVGPSDEHGRGVGCATTPTGPPRCGSHTFKKVIAEFATVELSLYVVVKAIIMLHICRWVYSEMLNIFTILVIGVSVYPI